ncbi:D-xylose ABC transporter ATP-binding protein [candidate division KSB3 bacterium]|uniref:D-xylose ABC transporter ATP-binding protein n=1 Tax=candidate division KSB3 bacterium TaxID=2044937 RepID=A0A2G6KD73_9BACT|nr:MAG: D-xylose ABC transporter ATP-binding protein [candidate division KSB3 bacterium]
MSTTILEMRHINKSFPGVHVLKDVDLELQTGEVHILLGENGAGKSTLIKILSGAYSLDSGEIIFEGKRVHIAKPTDAQELGITTIYQEFNLIPYLSVSQNIYLGREPLSPLTRKLDRKKLREDTEALFKRLHLDVDPNAKIIDLGVAEQQMVEIAKALSVNSKILIMDEPTSALTDTEIENLFAIIKNIQSHGVSIIYISHRLEEFKHIGDRVTIMRDGEAVTTLDVKNTNLDEMIQHMVGRDIGNHYPKAATTPGEEILSVKKLTRETVFKDVNFNLKSGEVLGICGLMGAGRTEIMRSLFGIDPKDSGEIFVHGKKVDINHPRQAIKAGIGFLTEKRREEGLVLLMDIEKNVTLASLEDIDLTYKLDKKKERRLVSDYIESLKIKCTGREQQAETLSGGNQQKVVIAKWLMSKSDIFIMDEPTRGIDVGAKIEVYHLMNSLVAKGNGIILISSDLPEVLGMSDRILVVCRGEIVKEFSREEATQEKVMYYATGGERCHESHIYEEHK